MSVVWISDALHDILGLSDQTTESYIVSLARKSKSEKDILDQLILENDFPATQATRNLASRLYQQLGIKQVVQEVAAYKKHETEMIIKRRKNENFQLITENDVESDSESEENQVDAKTLKFMKDLEDIKSKKA